LGQIFAKRGLSFAPLSGEKISRVGKPLVQGKKVSLRGGKRLHGMGEGLAADEGKKRAGQYWQKKPTLQIGEKNPQNTEKRKGGGLIN